MTVKKVKCPQCKARFKYEHLCQRDGVDIIITRSYAIAKAKKINKISTKKPKRMRAPEFTCLNGKFIVRYNQEKYKDRYFTILLGTSHPVGESKYIKSKDTFITPISKFSQALVNKNDKYILFPFLYELKEEEMFNEIERFYTWLDVKVKEYDDWLDAQDEWWFAKEKAEELWDTKIHGTGPLTGDY